MIYIVIKKYYKSLKCYNIKYKKHIKYKKIIKLNRYLKINDPRGEFSLNDKIVKNKNNTAITRYDKF